MADLSKETLQRLHEAAERPGATRDASDDLLSYLLYFTPAILKLLDEHAAMRAALAKVTEVEDQYRSQMRFCDIDPLPYFREFTDRLHRTGCRAALANQENTHG